MTGCPGCRTCSFHFPVPAQLPGEHTALLPFCKVLVTIQTHKQSLFNQVPIHSWVKRVHMQVKCLAQGHSVTPWQLRPVPKASQSKVAGHSHHPTMPCMYMEYIYIFGCRDTEGAGGHCQGPCHPQWFFYIPLQVSETAPPFT